MRLEFFLSVDLMALARRYALVTGLRMGWLWLLSLKLEWAINGLLPGPAALGSPFSGLWLWLSNPWQFGRALPALVNGGLALVQLGLLVGLAVGALRRYAPRLADRLPAFFHDAAKEGELDGRRLVRAWWMTPLLMTVCLIVTFYLIVGFLSLNSGLYARITMPVQGMGYAKNWPLYFALGLGAIGLLRGHAFNVSAATTLSDDFKVQMLPDDHELTQRVHGLAARLNLPPPKVGVTKVVNAFAMGPSIDKATVVLGVPLIRNLEADELDAVIGHELGHVISGDMRRMQYAEGYQRAFAWVFSVIVTTVTIVGAAMARSRSSAQLGMMAGNVANLAGRALLNLGGEVIVKGVSRSREYYADAIGAGLTTPQAMIGALEKLHRIPADASPGESEYAYLMFKGFSSWTRIFATHPDVALRCKALETQSHLRMLPRKQA